MTGRPHPYGELLLEGPSSSCRLPVLYEWCDRELVTSILSLAMALLVLPRRLGLGLGTGLFFLRPKVNLKTNQIKFCGSIARGSKTLD